MRQHNIDNGVQNRSGLMAKAEVSKRKIGDVDIRDSPYFKIRALVSLLRPRFLQVPIITITSNVFNDFLLLVCSFYFIFYLISNKYSSRLGTTCYLFNDYAEIKVRRARINLLQP